MSDKIRMLFVDDEEEFVNYMSKHLRLHDFDVVPFTSPLKALEAAKEQKFDVCLLDLKMPDMDGEQVLEKLKKIDSRIEVIILSGHGDIDTAFRTGKAGAYEFLNKPCDFDDLVNSINDAFANRIKTLSEAESTQVDSIMAEKSKVGPLGILGRLKKLKDKLENDMAASGMAQEGDWDSSREISEKK